MSFDFVFNSPGGPVNFSINLNLDGNVAEEGDMSISVTPGKNEPETWETIIDLSISEARILHFALGVAIGQISERG